ncbi:hypothetical protein EVAR_13935_1 [Eumeta japonica]|uniref:Uncharacterized protein n=1 Tax=Eumeta variegata TaxID=151549 RepID=A0A4C1U8F3_EUMVA|nr:hypothetical protein EVAR_13935_1 [Eumeta japonica]
MSPVWRSSKVSHFKIIDDRSKASYPMTIVTTKQKRAASPSPIHRSPKQNYRVPIGRSARAVDTCHSPGLPLSFMSRPATHPHPLQLRINLCGCGCGCRNWCGCSACADADANIRNIPSMELVGLVQQAFQRVAECVASYRVGQLMLRHMDRALWVLEKSARWAVPPPRTSLLPTLINFDCLFIERLSVSRSASAIRPV